MTTGVAGNHSHDTNDLDAALAAEVGRAELAEAGLATRITALEAGTPPPVEPPPVEPPPVEPPPPAAGAFLSYPKSAAKVINGGTDVILSSLTFQGDMTKVAIVLQNVNGFWLHDLDIDHCLGGLYLVGCTGTGLIENIRARNIGNVNAGSGKDIGAGHGNVIQLNGTYLSDGRVRRVKAVGGHTEDMFSVYKSGGTDDAHRLVIEDCQLEGLVADTADNRAWASDSGSGMMLGDGGGHDIVIQRCTILTPGQVGIGLPGGVRIHLLSNTIYGAKRPLANVGIYAKNYAGGTYGPHELTGNKVKWYNAAGSENPVWLPDIGSSVQSGNDWHAAIDPATLTVTL